MTSNFTFHLIIWIYTCLKQNGIDKMLAPIIELAIIMVCFALPERRVSRFNIFSTTSKCARYFLGNNIVLHANRFSFYLKLTANSWNYNSGCHISRQKRVTWTINLWPALTVVNKLLTTVSSSSFRWLIRWEQSCNVCSTMVTSIN